MAARQVQMIQRTMELQRMQQRGRGRGGGDDGSFIQYGGSDAGTLHRAPQRAASASVSQAAGRAAPPAARSAPQANGGSSASELAKAAADAATHFGYHSAIKSMFLKWKFPFVLYFLQRFAGLLKLSERCASDADRASGYTSSPIMIQLIDCLLGSSDGLTPRSIDPRKNPYIGRLRKWCEHIVSIAGGFECERFNAHHWRAVDERLQALFTACSVALRAEIFQRVRNACGGRGRLSAACVHVPFVPSIIAHPLPSSSLLPPSRPTHPRLFLCSMRAAHGSRIPPKQSAQCRCSSGSTKTLSCGSSAMQQIWVTINSGFSANCLTRNVPQTSFKKSEVRGGKMRTRWHVRR